jgi:hypothetical protein
VRRQSCFYSFDERNIALPTVEIDEFGRGEFDAMAFLDLALLLSTFGLGTFGLGTFGLGTFGLGTNFWSNPKTPLNAHDPFGLLTRYFF